MKGFLCGGCYSDIFPSHVFSGNCYWIVKVTKLYFYSLVI